MIYTVYYRILSVEELEKVKREEVKWEVEYVING
jgi:hypothetical protein